MNQHLHPSIDAVVVLPQRDHLMRIAGRLRRQHKDTIGDPYTVNGDMAVIRLLEELGFVADPSVTTFCEVHR